MKILSALLIVFMASFGLSAQSPYWQQSLDYRIDVTLNDKDHTLDAFLRLQYTNHSPDTLSYIWFHLWPNAYRNDRTAFSEQLLENGRTDFYFSDKTDRGYINRLDFRSNNELLRTEDHPSYIDVIKVILDKPLAPGQQVEITTPFHVKLPKVYSRSGYADYTYLITQWYPKPAVYDRQGWHPMPYLDQGEFYSEYASFDVRITIPENFVVAATGELQDAAEKAWLASRTQAPQWPRAAKAPGFLQPKPGKTTAAEVKELAGSDKSKTIRYLQQNVHDFAWFASKYFRVSTDTLALASGRIIQAYSFYTDQSSAAWKNSLSMIKDAIRFRSAAISEYPYNVVSVVQGPMGLEGGMEYPTITSITNINNDRDLDLIIEHEIGHNWFYGILGSNERAHPWMDEGINTYYDRRYMYYKYRQRSVAGEISKKLPEDAELALIDALSALHKDQPLNTASENFTDYNYNLLLYYKTAALLEQLADSMGQSSFDEAMRAYYEEWKFRHPAPADFMSAFSKHSPIPAARFEQRLAASHEQLKPIDHAKKIKPALLFNFRNTGQYQYIGLFPAIGYRKYDGFMIGAIVHNYNLPPQPFQFIAAPLFGLKNKQLGGLGAVKYNWYPEGFIQKIQLGVQAARFSTLKGNDSLGKAIFGGFDKIVPYLRLTLNNTRKRSTVEKYVEWRTFLIGEKGFNYRLYTADSLYYPTTGKRQSRYLNQLTFTITDYRILYPYDLSLQIQQGDGFYRASLTGNYFLNYVKGGGASVRLFAAKFGYLGGRTSQKVFDSYVYQPKLTAVGGTEDYTYSNAFFGRTESNGWESQQMMVRDGALKIRTDIFQGLQGRSEDWITAINLTTTIPAQILPKFIPLKLFLDFGTYAEAWKKDAPTRRFLYVGGLQLSFFKDLLNIYAPLIYSSEFSDNLKTLPEENKFFRKLSFSLDIQKFNWRKISNNKLPL